MRFDYVSLMEKLRDEREEGRMEGRREGEARGRREAEQSIIEKMLRSGMTQEQIRAVMCS